MKDEPTTQPDDQQVSPNSPVDPMAEFCLVEDPMGDVPLPVIREFENFGEAGPGSEQHSSKYQFPTFRNDTFDDKTTQLIVFAMLLASGTELAKHYADAARGAGASWKELYTVAELASGIGALKPFS